jgi:hypothetical protein
MSFEAGSITAKLGLDISPYTKGMLQATSIAHLFPETVQHFLASPLLGLVHVAEEVKNALVEMFNASAEAAHHAETMANNVGVAVDELSALGLVAKQHNIDIEEVADSYRFLGKNMVEAGQGNKTVADVFRKLGVDVNGADGKLRPLNETLMQVADGLKALPEGGERSYAALTLLGRGGFRMVGMLAEGSAAIKEQEDRFRSYGAVVTEKAAQSGTAWLRATGEMGIAWKGFQNLIAEPLRDALMPYLTNLLTWVRTHPEEIRGIAARVAATVTAGLAGIVAIARVLSPVLEVIVNHLGAAGFVAAALLAIKVISGLVAAFRTMATAQAIVLSLSGPAGWAVLATGAVLAGAAVAGVAVAFSNASEEMKKFQDEAAKSAGAVPAVGGGGAAAAPSASAAAPRVVINEVNIDLDPDLGAASSQIAEKIRPQLDEAVRSRFRQADNAAQAAMLKL